MIEFVDVLCVVFVLDLVLIEVELNFGSVLCWFGCEDEVYEVFMCVVFFKFDCVEVYCGFGIVVCVKGVF